MSVVRLLPAWLHAVADYAVAAALIIGALAVGGSSGAVATGVVVGIVVAVVSTFTTPSGYLVNMLTTVHSAGDYLASALLILAPFVINFRHGDTGLAVFYVIAGLAVLAVSLVTNYQYSPKREWSGVGAAPQTA